MIHARPITALAGFPPHPTRPIILSKFSSKPCNFLLYIQPVIRYNTICKTREQ